MLKVVHVIHGLNTGGAETLVKDYALKIDKSKFDFKIICLDKLGSPYEKLLEDNNIEVMYLSNKTKSNIKTNFLIKIFYKIKSYWELKRKIKQENPDILHTHLTINNMIKFARPKKATKIYHTVHNEPKVLWRKGNIQRKLDLYATKWLIKKYKMRLIVLHEETAEEVNQMFNVNNSIVLNNGIDFTHFDYPKDKEEVRKKLGIPNDTFVIGHVGRFSFQKNHEFLIDIFNEYHKVNEKSFLLMIGDGLEKQNIENKLKELNLKNKYLILSNRLDIPDLLNLMDAFVFPSKYEGLGISLIEAQKMKIPCFVSDKIPKHAIISNLVTKITLNEPAKIWAEMIMEYKFPKEIILNDEEWDMRKVVIKLQDIYLGKY